MRGRLPLVRPPLHHLPDHIRLLTRRPTGEDSSPPPSVLTGLGPGRPYPAHPFGERALDHPAQFLLVERLEDVGEQARAAGPQPPLAGRLAEEPADPAGDVDAAQTPRIRRATTEGVRKLSFRKLASVSPIRSLLRGMIAVCGIGRPSGWRKRAVTANQSAMPPTSPASAKAWAKPQAGWASARLATAMKIAAIPASIAVASARMPRESRWARLRPGGQAGIKAHPRCIAMAGAGSYPPPADRGPATKWRAGSCAPAGCPPSDEWRRGAGASPPREPRMRPRYYSAAGAPDPDRGPAAFVGA